MPCFAVREIFACAGVEILQVFPCRCELSSSEQGAEMEREVTGHHLQTVACRGITDRK